MSENDDERTEAQRQRDLDAAYRAIQSARAQKYRPATSSFATIIAYWSERVNEMDMGCDWDEAHRRCWRCARETHYLQRCHIVPSSCDGMGNTPANLVLLCGDCHREAPNVADIGFMWEWIKAHRVGMHDRYWLRRGLEEFRLIYGRLPRIPKGASKEQVRASLERLDDEVGIHGGSGGINPATRAWMLRQQELYLWDGLPEKAEFIELDPSRVGW